MSVDLGVSVKIESEDIDVESLLSGRFFNIPRFQRPYSWEDENIQELWDDVMSAKGEDYFIGSMVVYREGKQEFSVVDGQQRLTTITILLCALRDAYAELGNEDLALGIHQLVERKNRSNKNEYVLRTETSFPYLQERILKYGQPDIDNLPELSEELALKRASALLAKRVGSLIAAVDVDQSIPAEEKPDVKIERLTAVRDSVLNLKIILVKLENEDDAYLIFETLNTRGKDLAVTDLAKNHLTKLLKAKGPVDSVKIKWNAMLQTIHESAADIDSDAFLYHFWASRHEAVPMKKLYAVMKRKVTAKNARAYVDALVRDSEFYRAIHEPSYMWDKNERDLARSFAAIQLFRVVQPTPALLAVVRAYKDGKIKLRKAVEVVDAIEKFHFTFTAITSSRSSGGISGMYASFARKLFESSDSNQAAIEIKLFIQKLRERRPPFDEFLFGFRSVGFTNSNTKQKGLVRYMLRKFSEDAAFRFAVDWEDLTIEHFAPQAWIGSPGWDDSVVGQMGNLFLIDGDSNEFLASKSPTEKKKHLVDQRISFPEFVRQKSDWQPSDVGDHTEEMAKRAYETIWKI